MLYCYGKQFKDIYILIVEFKEISENLVQYATFSFMAPDQEKGM